MIELKNVSKYYYSKGNISSGINRVNLKLNMGEFVVITGESGSGKSTLLNVLSGLDSYEEGEMYINGEETSHYSEKDYELYRKKYIGNIFQTFNLVNSYTVYQNIELILLLSGENKKKIKKKINDILKSVGLYEFRKTKVSKLSGGQKQRVAIARSLAKDTPIIVADEPTGNLDTKSAESVLKLLHDISKNKLVIIVTHNFEQVEKYATRVIKMHDGKVLENKIVKEMTDTSVNNDKQLKEISMCNKIRLGIRNAFNIPSKFLLITFIYLFASVALITVNSSFKRGKAESLKDGDNFIFWNKDRSRIVVKKNDNSLFTNDDIANIKKLNNIQSVYEDDLLLDQTIDIDNDEYYFYGTLKPLSELEKVEKGVMPTTDDEIVIAGNKNNYYFIYESDGLLDKTYTVLDYTTNLSEEIKVKVTGMAYSKDSNYGECIFYVSDKLLETLNQNLDNTYSEVSSIINGKKYTSNNYDTHLKVSPNKKVPKGNAYINYDDSYICKNNNCINSNIKITVKNIYYEDQIDLKITKTYSKKTLKSLTGLKSYDEEAGKIFINDEDYSSLFDKGHYQISVFVDDEKIIDNTVSELNDMGYSTLKISDVLVNYSEEVIALLNIFKLIVNIILIVVLFFISYFVIRLILKSRNTYYATLRILGASKKVTNQLLNIELLTLSIISYLIAMTLVYLTMNDIIHLESMKEYLSYLTNKDYITLLVIILCMSYLIAVRYARKIFTSSAMNSYREAA